jgi:transposase
MTTVTVLTGPERRRRWSAEEKARIVEESIRPGALVSAVAQRHDVHPSLLHHWRRQARQAGAAMGFLPVNLPPSRVDEPAGAMVIELGGEVRVRVDAAVDEAALARVLRALGR